MPQPNTATTTSECRARAVAAAEHAYALAGHEASEHFKKHGNVMSPERARLLAWLTAARLALVAARSAL